MPRARINGADLYYEEHGSGPALVFVHGGGGNHLSWWQQVPVVLAHAIAASPTTSAASAVDSGRARRSRRAGRRPARAARPPRASSARCLVAQSLGGWAVWGAAARQPRRVRALLMADTPGSVPAPRRSSSSAACRSDMRSGEAPLARAIWPRWPRRARISRSSYWQIQALNPPLAASAGGTWRRSSRAAYRRRDSTRPCSSSWARRTR